MLLYAFVFNNNNNNNNKDENFSFVGNRFKSSPFFRYKYNQLERLTT